jgi:hypothetical protein
MLRLDCRLKTGFALNQRARMDDLYMSINQHCVERLMLLFDSELRVMSLNHKYKTAFCIRAVLSYINQTVFPTRFDPAQQEIKARSLEGRTWFTNEAENQINSKMDAGGETPFTGTLAYSLVHAHPYRNFNRLIFRESDGSLYNRLYEPDRDYELTQMLEQIFQAAFRGFQRKYLTTEIDGCERCSFLATAPLDFTLEKRSRTLDKNLAANERLLHQAVQHKTFDKLKGKFEGNNTLQHCTEHAHHPIVRVLKRNFAMQLYTEGYCEHILSSHLKPTAHKVNDSENLYFKRVEVIADPGDQDYNDISRRHGHKCQLTRDPAQLKFLMEVYVPTLVEKGRAKIAQYEAYMRDCKPVPSLFTQLRLADRAKTKLARNLKQKMLDHEVLVKPRSRAPSSKVFRALNQDGFETDNSMRMIDYNDIKSGRSEDSSSMDAYSNDSSAKQKSTAKKERGKKHKERKETKEPGFNKLMAIQKSLAFETPGEYYKRQKEQRERDVGHGDRECNEVPRAFRILSTEQL